MSPASQSAAPKIDAARLAGICRRYQVRELSMFGSAARGQSRNDSDLDLLVEFLPEADTDLVEFASLMQELSGAFGRSVDLISKPGLNARIRRTVLAEARPLYAV